MEGNVAVLLPLIVEGLLFVAFVFALLFTLEMTRQCISEDARMPDELRRRWDKRLLWLGPFAVVYLLMLGFSRREG